MKAIKYIMFALICTLFASCMGDSYAEPEGGEIPYGNNELAETNVLTIEQLKAKFASVISSSSMQEVTEDIQIKGYVTGNDAGGNIYNEISVQDETGAILICINQSGLYGSLQEGQQILISLKGLMIGGYGMQPEIGGIYTNTNTGAQSIGRMSRYLWNTHYKLLGTPDKSKILPEVFDISKISDASYLEANCGRLMTLKNVKLKDADGISVFAPNDGSVALTANCANRAFTGISTNQLVLRTSTYADFANQAMPQDEIDVTGIFTRYRNTWQILLRNLNDIQQAEPEPTAIFSETFGESQGDFKIVENIPLPDGLSYVWAWDARYGMKASAYVNSTYYETDSWLISPAIDLSKVNNTTLKFDQARRYGSGGDDVHVMVTTNYRDGAEINVNNWTELTFSEEQIPDGSNWNYLTSSASLSPYVNNSNVRIAFRYTSSTNAAATWEIKNFIVE